MNRVYFFHPTKTGGTSIIKAMGLNKSHSVLDHRSINRGYCFATVRNPYDRVKSMYCFYEDMFHLSFDEFLEVLKNNIHIDNRFFEQHRYTHMSGELVINMVIKLENIGQDLKKLPFNVTLLHENKDPKKGIKITKKQKSSIYEIYKKDFILLGYDK